ncbi:MAG: hypothetical protein R3F13_10390 [Prosthecobacter sp.]
MRARPIEFRVQGVRGFPGALLMVLGIVAVLSLLALLLFVGAAVVVGGLVLSGVAALVYTVRRKLAGMKAPRPMAENRPTEGGIVEVREIEVEVLPSREH